MVHILALGSSCSTLIASLEDERREVFTEATMRQSHQMRMPVTLEVGVSHIRITSVSNTHNYFDIFLDPCLPRLKLSPFHLRWHANLPKLSH